MTVAAFKIKYHFFIELYGLTLCSSWTRKHQFKRLMFSLSFFLSWLFLALSHLGSFEDHLSLCFPFPLLHVSLPQFIYFTLYLCSTLVSASDAPSVPGSCCRKEELFLPSTCLLSTVGLVDPTGLSCLPTEAIPVFSQCHDSPTLSLGQQEHFPTARILRHPVPDILGSVRQGW